MKVYVFIGLVLVVISAYFVGGRVASQKCKVQIAELNSNKSALVIKNMEEINEKTVNTGVRDIRRILYEKYTIAE